MLSFFNIFRLVAFLEGLSYVLLLFIATPLKYLTDNPTYVKLLGMPHGLLFMLYIICVVMLKRDHDVIQANFKKILLASIIPFGTFYIDINYLKR
ncbi:MAG: DUF3817 domain-containing protein [Flavobacteriaceae bacterium]|jgi:integral membrane protein|nr:DUF3817 domain-containing protein [Bacteroidota bacterium]MDC0957633.1 DUF3817 domain-containing protein [Flavobacteriaceae bacterium]MDG1378848.1 DUF3817 domain-containing protein [Flavobacteriaceae bacterium]MDG2350151.1 DUF3817 domain-containing protein [Flavobacteriaceae bacterium]|tara:strand:+ start:5170 stop:5454 length:285 start_codon:yes stop_codon:yes gene_type:complete